MRQSLRSGRPSPRVGLWLQHDNRRTRLSHTAPDWVIAEADLPPMERATVVTSVDGREIHTQVALPEGAPAGTRCRTVARATAAA